jgi:hypothetical protein
LRLRKSGTTFTGEYSLDGGSTWTEVDSVDIPEANATQDVGLVVSSHDTGNKCRVEFNDFTTV